MIPFGFCWLNFNIGINPTLHMGLESKVAFWYSTSYRLNWAFRYRWLLHESEQPAPSFKKSQGFTFHNICRCLVNRVKCPWDGTPKMFKHNSRWTFEPLTPDNSALVLFFRKAWYCREKSNKQVHEKRHLFWQVLTSIKIYRLNYVKKLCGFFVANFQKYWVNRFFNAEYPPSSSGK